MDKKRLIAIVVFVAAAGLLGYGLYRVFFRPTIPPPPPPPPGVITPPPGELPSAGEGVPREGVPPPGELPTARPGEREAGLRTLPTLPAERRLVADTVVGARADATGRVSFYNDTDGKFYRVDPDGKLMPLSDEVFFNVENVTWSPRADETIIEYPDGSNIYYNFQTKRQVTLPKHWESFSFAPQGDRIAAKSIGLSPENRWLVTANPDGNTVTLVAPLGENADKVTVDWSPNNQVVGFSRTGDALGGDREEVLLVGLQGENFKSLVVEGRDMRSRWSTDGKKILYSVYSARSDFKPELWIVNGEGDDIGSGRRLLNINTWADKCAFADARTVFCGVPETLETGAGFAPALANGPDRLVKIDIQTGARVEVPLEESHTIQSITVSPGGKSVFFTDTQQRGVFQVTL